MIVRVIIIGLGIMYREGRIVKRGFHIFIWSCCEKIQSHLRMGHEYANRSSLAKPIRVFVVEIRGWFRYFAHSRFTNKKMVNPGFIEQGFNKPHLHFLVLRYPHLLQLRCVTLRFIQGRFLPRGGGETLYFQTCTACTEKALYDAEHRWDEGKRNNVIKDHPPEHPGIIHGSR